MKKDIHPKYYPDAKIICACGNIIRTGATVSEMKVEICSACHPFYTGKKKSLDMTGRVDRFKKLAEKASEKKAVRTKREQTKKAKKTKIVRKTVKSKKKK
jgi:large subunit ribosomal protein L31